MTKNGEILDKKHQNIGSQYMDFVEISTFHWICLLFILFILVGIELPLCIVVTLS